MNSEFPLKVSFFRGLKYTTPEGNFSIIEILKKIQTGEWRDDVLKCRQDLIFKKQLPCFTPAGIFSHRSENGLVHYNGTQTLDIDGVDHPEILKEVCKSIPWVFAAFITPSGKGLKVIIRTNAVREEFTAVGIEVNEHFRQITGYNRDENCKDISRIHYVSWDKGLYLNESAEVFKKTTPS